MRDALDVRPVPASTRVLQIGPFKTGTTAIQHAASGRRAELAARGVVYPGTGLNHRWGCSALVGFTWGWTKAEAETAGPRHGQALLREVAQAPRNARIWISYERLAVLDEAQAKELCERIGGRVHVLVGLRPLRSLLASEWQQMIKSGRRPGPLDDWAQRTLDAIGDGTVARHLDHAGLVERWAGIVGSDGVTCIALDPEQPEMLPRALEGLLGLPEGLLDPPATGALRNRALTVAELELVGAVAHELREAGLTRADYMDLVGRGMIPRLLERQPGPEEARIRLGAEVAARAREVDLAAAGRVRASGVRVVGDLDRYAGVGADAGPAAEDSAGPSGLVPVEVAVAAVLGAAEQLRAAWDEAAPVAAVRTVRGSLGRRLRRRAAALAVR
ncbi:MAG: hypothetical protein KDB60_10305 [Propionibacteriaceae bacterium]|nr:hypothetical protein [Propionibacteriaceae bacterium]